MSRRYRRWHDLSKPEAREIFEEHVAGHDARVADAVAAYRRLGSAADDLDFTRMSLEPVWEVAMRQSLPAEQRRVEADEGPLWVQFWAMNETLGADLSWLVSWTAAYYAETAMRHSSRVTFVLGDMPGTEGHNQPLLWWLPDGPFAPIEVNVAILMKRGMTERGNTADRTYLRWHFDTFVGLDPNITDRDVPSRPSPSEPPPEWSVTKVAPGEFLAYHGEDVSDELSPRLDRLADALADAPRIKRVFRSDREVIAIHGRYSDTSLHDLLTETWQTLGPTSEDNHESDR